MDKEAKKQLKEYTKKLIYEAKQRKKLLELRSDNELIDFANRFINDNPDIRIEIKLKNGTVLTFTKQQENKRKDPFLGV